MKSLISLVSVLVIGLFAFVNGAQAREGNINLSNSDLACEGVSIWRESTYKITGRCQGLVYPYETQLDHYIIWAKLENGNYSRIDDIDRGYFEGAVNESFTDIVITAEDEGTPRRPSTTEVVAGSITAFDFDTSETTTAITPTPTPEGAKATPAPAAVQSGATAGSIIGRILKALLVIVAVIIVVAVVASLIFRRRGSVSA